MDSAPAGRHSVTVNDGYKKVSISHGASLLAGLARNGIFVPSSCGGNGQCGWCKVQITDGAPEALPREEPFLSPMEKDAGFRLSCQVKVKNDLKITLPQEIFSIRRFIGKLISKRLLTYDILHLRAELTSPEAIEFAAGQYIQIRSQPYEGKQSVLRSFSIASTPSDKNHVDLMIRKVPGGICTPWAFDHLKVGDSIYFTAPYGEFKLSGGSAPLIFIAGGSGMGPIWSMLNDMKENGVGRKALYFFGALTRRDLFLMEELHRMEREMADFTFIPALSNEPDHPDWKYPRGLISDVVARHLPDCSGHEAYLCGSPAMIEACKTVLLNGGIEEKDIFYDKFS